MDGAPTVLLSIMTGPLLLGLIGAKAVADGLTQLGIASEEFFRGERLPSLPNLARSAGQIERADPE